MFLSLSVWSSLSATFQSAFFVDLVGYLVAAVLVE
jgi:hypothetical protein